MFGVGEEAGLEVEEELCGADVDHFFSADEGCCLAGRTKDTAVCQSKQNLDTACMENAAHTQLKI